MLPLVIVLVVVPAAAFHQFGVDAQEQQRYAAAQRLAASAQQSPPAAATSPTSSAPATSPASSAPALPSSTHPSSSAPSSLQTPVRPAIALPPVRFAWPAAGLSVPIVPMTWTPGLTVDPPLDSNNFDPVAHWLQGTGQSATLRPIVLAAHACHQQVPLCNDDTFPFNRLSYAGWTVGQPATLTDAHGQTVTCALADRRIVDKSKAFTFANDPCSVVVFSCNFEDPDGQIVLLTFRCGQCT